MNFCVSPLIEVWNYQYRWNGKWYTGHFAAVFGRQLLEVKQQFASRCDSTVGDTLTIWRQGYSDTLVNLGTPTRIKVRDRRKEI